jgi:hypothetical protein
VENDMARKYRLYQVDSFTKEKLSANPAGVITNADGLSSGEMQRIARELNVSSKYAGKGKFFFPQKTFLHKSRKVG